MRYKADNNVDQSIYNFSLSLAQSDSLFNNQQVNKEISIVVKDPNLLEAVHYAQDVKDFEKFDWISNTKIDLPSTFKRIELVLRTNEKLK